MEKTVISLFLVDQLFRPASHQVETVEKALARLCRAKDYVPCKGLLPGNNAFQPKMVGKVNPRLKRMIPIKHGLTVLWHRYTTCTSNFPPKRLKQPLTSSVGMNLT